MSNLSFHHENITGKIESAKLVDLTTSKTYNLETKINRKTNKPSVCLFSGTDKKVPVISKKGKAYSLVFRLDFNDMAEGRDPTLDIDLFNEQGKVGIGEQELHRTKKQLSDGLWTYSVNGSLIIDNDAIPLSFEFQVSMTIAHGISVRANIAKAK